MKHYGIFAMVQDNNILTKWLDVQILFPRFLDTCMYKIYIKDLEKADSLTRNAYCISVLLP